MSQTTYQKLLENSIASALSAIEIYNKPDFKYRNEIFTIVNINAWELLLKAKILKDNKDNIQSIYVMDQQTGKPRVSRTGNNLTIEIIRAINLMRLDETIKQNLTKLIEIRDSAIHFYNDETIGYLIYILGAASLKNYQTLVKSWFNRSLLEYHFYIMPLGFNYNFQTISLVDLEKKPEIIAKLVKSVSEIKSTVNETKGFHFTCEIATQVISAKKLVGDADLTMAVNQDSENVSVIIEKKNLLDIYPLAYYDIMGKIKEKVKGKNQNEIHKIINTIKGNEEYSTYNFRTNKHRKRFEETGQVPGGTACIYNHDAVRFIIGELEKNEPPRLKARYHLK